MVHGPGDEQHRFFGVLRRMDDRRPAILLDQGLARMLAIREIVALPSAHLPAHLRARVDTRQDLFASSARLRQELGYVPPIERTEGLRRTSAWERANPPATIDPALFDYAAEDAALAARA